MGQNLSEPIHAGNIMGGKTRIDKNAVAAVLQGEAVYSRADLPKHILATDFIDEQGCTTVIAHNPKTGEGLIFHVDAIRNPAEVLEIIGAKGKGFTLTFATLDLSPANAHWHRLVELADQQGFQHRTLQREKIAIDLCTGTLLNLDLRQFFAGRSRSEFKHRLESEVNALIHNPFNQQAHLGPWDYQFIPLRYSDLSIARGANKA